METKIIIKRQYEISVVNDEITILDLHKLGFGSMVVVTKEATIFNGTIEQLQEQLNKPCVSNNEVVVCPLCESNNCDTIQIPMNRCIDCGVEW